MAGQHRKRRLKWRVGSGEKAMSLGLSRRYSTALRRYLTQGRQASLQPAWKLGREALAAGLGTADVSEVHRQAMIRLGTSDGVVGRAKSFLVEALTPIHNHGHLPRLIETIRRRNGELAAANRHAKQETVRRKGAETALRKSEQHNNLLLKEAIHMQEHLRHLSRRVLSAQEEERKQISRELHDEIGQILTGVTVRLATLKKEAAANTKGLEKKIASTQRLLEKTMKIVHRFARELRPALLDELGLIPALHAFMKQFTKRTLIPIKFTVFAAVERLNSDKRTVLYRVGQESLTNVAKHAHATRVSVDIRRLGGHVRMEIHDDGRAFQVQRVLSATRVKRLGLLGMRERVEMVGGVFSVDSALGKGTTIRALIPMSGSRQG